MNILQKNKNLRIWVKGLIVLLVLSIAYNIFLNFKINNLIDREVMHLQIVEEEIPIALNQELALPEHLEGK